MSRRRLHRVALVLVALLVLGGGLAVAAAVAAGRSPLAGERSHDFGVLPIVEEQVVAEHTFRLTNRSDDAVVVEKVLPSCGCTSVVTSAREVEPGGTLELTAALTIGGTGEKSSTIEVVYRHRGEQKVRTLRVRGIGRRVRTLTTRRTDLPLRPGGSDLVGLSMEVADHDEPPPDPRLIVPEGLGALFNGWQRHQRRDRRKHTPARWQGTVLVTSTGETIPAGAQLVIRVEPDQELAIDLVDADETSP